MKLTSKETVEYIKANLKEFGGEMNQSQVARAIGKTSGRVCQIAKKLRGAPQDVPATTEAAAA